MSDQSQQGRQEFGTDVGEVRHEPAQRRWPLRLYVAAMVLSPFLLVLGTMYWMSTGQYLRHVQYPYLADTGYGMRLRGADCQIVITGDSTAMVGVVPQIIEQRTGLKTCNIAEVAGVQKINGFMVPDTYLQHNERPRFMVFLYAPENLVEASKWHEVSDFEGVFFRLQFHPDLNLLKNAIENPNDYITDAELGLRTGVQWLFSPSLAPEKLHARELSGGRMPEPATPLTQCPAVLAVRQPDAAWLASIRKRYSAAGTKVLIDTTPTPECDSTFNLYRDWLKPGMVDESLGTMPIGMYTNSGRLHTTEAGAAVLSGRLADQIVQLEKGDR